MFITTTNTAQPPDNKRETPAAAVVLVAGSRSGVVSSYVCVAGGREGARREDCRGRSAPHLQTHPLLAKQKL